MGYNVDLQEDIIIRVLGGMKYVHLGKLWCLFDGHTIVSPRHKFQAGKKSKAAGREKWAIDVGVLDMFPNTEVQCGGPWILFLSGQCHLVHPRCSCPGVHSAVPTLGIALP